MAEHFDLLVIGGGSGGLATAIKSASYGVKTAIVDIGPIGGTCVNMGCVPKKITWYAGQLAESYQLGFEYGFQNHSIKFDFEKFVTQRQQFILKLHQSYKDKIKKNNIHYLYGQGIFQDRHTIEVNNQCYTANHIVIATGCYPKPLNIPGAELCINSDEFFQLKKQPEAIAIIGGGYIGVELASILNRLGSKVKLLIRKDKPLRQFDSLISQTLANIMTQQDIEIFPYHEATNILQDKTKKLIIHCQDNKKVSDIDAVLFAIGRNPRIENLNLTSVGIKTNDAGFIITDKWNTTNIPHIYAIGDVTGKKLLTPVAIAAGKKLAAHLFSKEKNSYLDYENIPTVIFTHPPIGSIGITEQVALEKYGKDKLDIDYREFKPLFYAFHEEVKPSYIKLISLKNGGKILGCHLIGLNADEILQGFAVAIKMGATKHDFENTVSIHPTSAEELVLQ